MESIKDVIKMLESKAFIISKDLKDAFFSVLINLSHQVFKDFDRRIL